MINIRNCVFGFKCNADWTAMKLIKETPDTMIRHCADCNKEVYQVSTKDQLVKAIELNHCVAIFLEQDESNQVLEKTCVDENHRLRLGWPTLGVPSSYKVDDVDDYDIPAFLRNVNDKK